jgi:DNA polymerase elongation subunit (family B)
VYTNTFYDNRRSQMHLWEMVDGKKEHTIHDWVPFCYVPVEENKVIKSIFGDFVERRNFETYKDYNAFCKDSYDIFENKVPPQIQFLTEYFNVDDPITPKLHVAYLDIETPHDGGFPNVTDTPAAVCLISIIDEDANITVFGLHPYDGEQKGKCRYVECTDEGELLNVFFSWMHREQFDVITGWNILADSKTNKFGGFDIPYLCRRSIKLLGDKGSLHRKLSPVGQVRMWDSVIEGVYNVDIAGVSIIDYLGLYKWFTTKNLESFRLDYVAEVEIGRKKIDHDKFHTFWDFYKGDWNLFVDYCIEDSNLVRDIETATGYLALAQTLSLYCCCPMKNYNASVPLIEGLMLKYFRKNDLCAPYMTGGTQVWFPAAYVKPPHIGMHKDVADLDIASSYPTHIIILNMSPETYWGRIVGFRREDVQSYKLQTGLHEPLHEGRPIYNMNVKYTKARRFPPFHVLKDTGFEVMENEKLAKFNKLLKLNMLAIAPNGAVFLNKPEGVIAHVTKMTYFERVKQKALKGEYKQKSIDDPDNKDHWMELSQNRHTLQWAIKILINSMFGVMGVPYCRYFNPHVAEAITSGGRHTIQQGEVFVNEYFAEPDDDLIGVLKEIEVECEKV